jgi:hypothetical protein
MLKISMYISIISEQRGAFRDSSELLLANMPSDCILGLMCFFPRWSVAAARSNYFWCQTFLAAARVDKNARSIPIIALTFFWFQ